MADAGFWVAQGVGVVAAMLGVIAFQLRRDTAMLALLGASALTWAIHFALLGAAAAAAINLVTAVRNFCGMRLRSRALAAMFAAFYIIAATLSHEHPRDLLPLAAVLLGTAAVFLLDGLRARGGFLAGSILWVIYNIQVWSLPGIAVMAADALSNARFIFTRLRAARRHSSRD